MNRMIALLPLLLPLYLLRFHIGPFPTTVLEIAIWVMLGVWTWQRGRKGWRDASRRLYAGGWVWPVSLWLLAGLIGVIIAPNHFAALGLYRAYFIEPLLVFAMLFDVLREDASRRRMLHAVVIVLGVLCVWAIVQFVTGIGIPHPWEVWPGRRATGPFPFPNALSLFVVPLGAMCIVRLCHFEQSEKSPEISPPYSRRNDTWGWNGRMWPLLGLLFAFISAILARSVGGIAGLFVAVVIAGITQPRTRRITLVITATLIAIALIIPTTRHKLNQQIFFHEWSGRVRLVIWKETRNMLNDRPFFGAGLGAYPTVIKPYHAAKWMEIFQYPHNILLNLWSETGVLGVIAFAWILIRWWRRGRSLALPIIAAILVHGLVDVPYFKNDLAVMFWMLIAMTERTRTS